jgi:hypothetical protein
LVCQHRAEFRVVKKDALAALDRVPLQLLALDRFLIGDRDHARRSDRRGKRQRVDPVSTRQEVDGSVYVRACVRAKRELRNGGDVTLLQVENALDPHRWIIRPMYHPGVEWDGDVDPGFARHTVAPFPSDKERRAGAPGGGRRWGTSLSSRTSLLPPPNVFREDRVGPEAARHLHCCIPRAMYTATISMTSTEYSLGTRPQDAALARI